MTEYLKRNYLRSCRRRLGLSQRQLAFILCLESANRVSALEHGHCAPTAAECVVFEALFGRSLAELWPTWAAEIERDTGIRTQQLLERIDAVTATSRRKQLRIQFASTQLESILQGRTVQNT